MTGAAVQERLSTLKLSAEMRIYMAREQPHRPKDAYLCLCPPPDQLITLDARISAIWAEALDLPPRDRLRVANLLVAGLEQLVAGGAGHGC